MALKNKFETTAGMHNAEIIFTPGYFRPMKEADGILFSHVNFKDQ